MRYLATVCLVASALQGAIIDRLAITVDQRVITEAQLDEEIRVTAFLNQEPVRRDADARRNAADRLIQQELVRRDMEVSRYPMPTQGEVDVLLADTKQQIRPDRFAAQLSQYNLTEDIVREHLRFQLMMLRFIDFRFRPDIQVSESDITAYYNQELEKWKSSHTGMPPSLEDSRASIEKAITNQRVDYAVSAWLEETRKQVRIIYLDKELE
jgi:hypothetical protein